MRKISVPLTRTRLREQGKCPGSGMAVSGTRSGTMKCPHCLRTYKVTKGGKLWVHVKGSPYWENRRRCHRRHSPTTRCTWCGSVKAR
jgi:hypothetical protein